MLKFGKPIRTLKHDKVNLYILQFSCLLKLVAYTLHIKSLCKDVFWEYLTVLIFICALVIRKKI